MHYEFNLVKRFLSIGDPSPQVPHCTKHDIHQLAAPVRTRLPQMQYRSGLLEGSPR